MTELVIPIRDERIRQKVENFCLATDTDLDVPLAKFIAWLEVHDQTETEAVTKILTPQQQAALDFLDAVEKNNKKEDFDKETLKAFERPERGDYRTQKKMTLKQLAAEEFLRGVEELTANGLSEETLEAFESLERGDFRFRMGERVQ